jgi:hypothetical protein
MPQQSRRSLLSSLIEGLGRLLGRKPEPGDPYAERLSPIRRGPKGRSGAAAVAEAEEDHGVFPPRKA